MVTGLLWGKGPWQAPSKPCSGGQGSQFYWACAVATQVNTSLPISLCIGWQTNVRVYLNRFITPLSPVSKTKKKKKGHGKKSLENNTPLGRGFWPLATWLAIHMGKDKLLCMSVPAAGTICFQRDHLYKLNKERHETDRKLIHKFPLLSSPALSETRHTWYLEHQY